MICLLWAVLKLSLLYISLYCGIGLQPLSQFLDFNEKFPIIVLIPYKSLRALAIICTSSIDLKPSTSTTTILLAFVFINFFLSEDDLGFCLPYLMSLCRYIFLFVSLTEEWKCTLVAVGKTRQLSSNLYLWYRM